MVSDLRSVANHEGVCATGPQRHAEHALRLLSALFLLFIFLSMYLFISLFLTPNSRSVFRAGVSLNINSFCFSLYFILFSFVFIN